MPNQRRLNLLLADAMRSLDDGGVIVHPPIQVMSQWVAGTLQRILWLKGDSMPRMMDPQQLLMAWQNAWPDSSGVLSQTEKFLAARQALAADRLIRQWYPSADEAWLDRDFFLAAREVSRHKRESNSCTFEEFLTRLCEQLETADTLPIALPESIGFKGFHEWTSLETRLLNALEQRGVRLQRTIEDPAPLERNETSHVAVSFATTDEELGSAAQWARGQLLQRQLNSGSGSGNEPPITVVIEGLDQSASRVRRIFEQVFASHESADDRNQFEDAFHLPYGPPLSQHAAIQDALLLLQLAMRGTRTAVTFATLSRCLLSPHWGGPDEDREARARLELQMRKEGVSRLSLSSLFEKTRQLPAGDAPAQSLDLLRSATDTDWLSPDALEQALRTLQWPGPLAKGASWSALVARFSSLLERARNLDGIQPIERLQALQNLCLSQQQQGTGGPLSPVQVLTPDDAVGGTFSSAWVAGLSAARWPGQPLSNPFLPANVTHHIPRTSAAGELAWCERITNGLRNLAPRVIFSWPAQVDDVQQSPSPLIADLPVISRHTLPGLEFSPPDPGSNPGWNSYAQHPWLEEVADGPGIPLAENEPIRGGAATLTDQSASPLAAYLKHRLSARFEPMPDAFADAAWRGQLMHRALHTLYRPVLGKHPKPESFDIPAAIEAAMQSIRAFNRLSSIQYRAEQQRLERLLQSWLEFDLQRPPFRVAALEEELNTQLLGHPIRLRVDRVDDVGQENGEGGLLIIDYKSSAGSLAAWARDRIGETQLPLYATVWQGETAVAGLALAAVSYGKVSLNGVVADKSLQYDRMKPFQQNRSSQVYKRFDSLPEALDQWRSSILEIAGEFIAGHASHTVFDAIAYTVQELAPLLRIQEGSEWRQQRGQAQ